MVTLAVLGASSTDGQASAQGFVPNAEEALDFNAKAIAAGLFPTNTPESGSGNGPMGVSTQQATPPAGWSVYTLLDMGFSNVRGGV